MIAGHHEEEGFIDYIKDDKRIIYLKALPVEEINHLENHSLANINPRPYSEEFDQYSIPSKTIEYLSSSSVTISLYNSILYPLFENEMIWAKDNEIKTLEDCLNKALTMNETERKDMINNAKNKAKSRYSLKIINEKIDLFLTKNFQ